MQYNAKRPLVQWSLLIFLLAALCAVSPARAGERAPVLRARILAEYPHDKDAFTQGLFVLPGGDLVESTGLYGKSEIRRVRLV